MPFIIVSGHIGEDVAVQCMREGASDYLLKDRLARLGPASPRRWNANASCREPPGGGTVTPRGLS